MKLNTIDLDEQLISTVQKTIDTLSTKVFKLKRDNKFIETICNKDKNDQFNFILSIVEGQFDSIDAFIKKGESVAVPFLGTFKFIQGKVIAKETKDRILNSKGYSSFNDILDKSIRTECKNEINTESIKQIRNININSTHGNRNVPIAFSLSKYRK